MTSRDEGEIKDAARHSYRNLQIDEVGEAAACRDEKAEAARWFFPRLVLVLR